MTTLKEFEAALRERGMEEALAILEALRRRDRARRSAAPARRIVGRRMTPELARQILNLHETTGMTQQEIAFRLGVNQGRVNEVVKHGKWLSGAPDAPEAIARDRALERAARAAGRSRREAGRREGEQAHRPRPARRPSLPRGRDSGAQLVLGDL